MMDYSGAPSATPRIVPYEIGCEPSPSMPSEVLLQNGWKTYLLFWAVQQSGEQLEHYSDVGVAVVECKGCSMTKFGYPNDEGLCEHPLYSAGMSDTAAALLEVIDSPWAHEVAEQKFASACRIWETRGRVVSRERYLSQRHFIVPLKQLTFECIASEMIVDQYFP